MFTESIVVTEDTGSRLLIRMTGPDVMTIKDAVNVVLKSFKEVSPDQVFEVKPSWRTERMKRVNDHDDLHPLGELRRKRERHDKTACPDCGRSISITITGKLLKHLGNFRKPCPASGHHPINKRLRATGYESEIERRAMLRSEERKRKLDGIATRVADLKIAGQTRLAEQRATKKVLKKAADSI